MNFDLTRLPNLGLTFWGMNNHEGRLPWGQVYVLDGMLDVVEKLALGGAGFDAMRAAMAFRLAQEISGWARLAKSREPWFWSRRYSLERADILSVVHLGRMARVAGRAMKAGIKTDPPLEELAAVLHREIMRFDNSVEERAGRQLRLKRGAKFWLDGANAPWNFQSAWIEGLAALEEAGIASGDSKSAAIAMTEDFIAAEISGKRGNLWQYCTGPCQEGWRADSNTSVNTPDWEGNKTRTSTAHVSYRAMDARAVLEAMRVWKLPNLDWFAGYAASLVESGWLYPMVSAPLARHGVAPKLHAGLTGRYGRAAIAFDIHNQIWALDQIAKNPGGCATR